MHSLPLTACASALCACRRPAVELRAARRVCYKPRVSDTEKGPARIELMWDGKYINGKKSAPIRIALPFQDIETVNESAQTRTLQLDLWGRGEERAWRNRLIWGDKKYVLPKFAGKINLMPGIKPL